jgi:hypothetical protein
MDWQDCDSENFKESTHTSEQKLTNDSILKSRQFLLFENWNINPKNKTGEEIDRWIQYNSKSYHIIKRIMWNKEIIEQCKSINILKRYKHVTFKHGSLKSERKQNPSYEY